MNKSPRFEKVRSYYKDGLWNEEMVRNASQNPKKSPWITKDEAEEIIREMKGSED